MVFCDKSFVVAGLSLGVLNLAIVIPQVSYSLFMILFFTFYTSLNVSALVKGVHKH